MVPLPRSVSLRGGGCNLVVARSESDEAIQLPAQAHWIASLTLAMTRRRHRSRGAYAPEFCLRPRTKNKFAPAKKEGGEAPKGACQPLPRVRRQVYAVCATYLLRGRAPNRGAPAFRRYAAALVRNCDISDSAPGHASWDVDSARCEHHARRKPAGVTRPILSQSSDSTSRLGRNTEGNDAQSRPGAGCKPARRHRTRSASESALAKASLDERDFAVCNCNGDDCRQINDVTFWLICAVPLTRSRLKRYGRSSSKGWPSMSFASRYAGDITSIRSSSTVT